MKKLIVIWVIIAVALIAVVVGYLTFVNKPMGSTSTEGTKTNSDFKTLPATTSKVASELVLDISDLPSGYTIKDRAPRLRSDVSNDGLSLGWKDGYAIGFMKGEGLTAFIIYQRISIYPVENMSKAVSEEQSNENITYEKISIGQIGDKSFAYKVTTKNEFIGDISNYEIEFGKKDVYEDFQTAGAGNDFELLQQLARKAASKV